MHVMTGETREMLNLYKQFESGEEKEEDWEELPEDIGQERLSFLQSPLNRHERRGLIHFIKNRPKASMRDLYTELRNIRIGLNNYKENGSER